MCLLWALGSSVDRVAKSVGLRVMSAWGFWGNYSNFPSLGGSFFVVAVMFCFVLSLLFGL